MSNVNEMLAVAIEETKQLRKDEEFTVRDLFKGYEWNRISRGDRLLLGTLFLNHVNTDHGHISPMEKTTSRQQKYRMI